VVLLGTQCWSSVLSSVVGRHWFSIVVVHCSSLSVTVHHLSVSSSSGVISFCMVTWPLMCRGPSHWGGVTRWVVDSGGVALVESDDRGRGYLQYEI